MSLYFPNAGGRLPSIDEVIATSLALSTFIHADFDASAIGDR
jgi:hypothetical protein